MSVVVKWPSSALLAFPSSGVPRFGFGSRLPHWPRGEPAHRRHERREPPLPDLRAGPVPTFQLASLRLVDSRFAFQKGQTLVSVLLPRSDSRSAVLRRRLAP
jgi:hypothetical protein